MKEGFTDADNFTVHYQSPSLDGRERLLVLTAAIFADLLYFERKASREARY